MKDRISDKINEEINKGVKKSLKSAKISYLMNAIDSWVKSNLEDVSFIGSFATHSAEGEVTDDRMIAYGPKKVLEMHLQELKKELEKEKDFVNW
ncbi:hypothetical protein ES705_39465 [subsurface metagenome]